MTLFLYSALVFNSIPLWGILTFLDEEIASSFHVSRYQVYLASLSTFSIIFLIVLNMYSFVVNRMRWLIIAFISATFSFAILSISQNLVYLSVGSSFLGIAAAVASSLPYVDMTGIDRKKKFIILQSVSVISPFLARVVSYFSSTTSSVWIIIQPWRIPFFIWFLTSLFSLIILFMLEYNNDNHDNPNLENYNTVYDLIAKKGVSTSIVAVTTASMSYRIVIFNVLKWSHEIFQNDLAENYVLFLIPITIPLSYFLTLSYIAGHNDKDLLIYMTIVTTIGSICILLLLILDSINQILWICVICLYLICILPIFTIVSYIHNSLKISNLAEISIATFTSIDVFFGDVIGAALGAYITDWFGAVSAMTLCCILNLTGVVLWIDTIRATKIHG